MAHAPNMCRFELPADDDLAAAQQDGQRVFDKEVSNTHAEPLLVARLALATVEQLPGCSDGDAQDADFDSAEHETGQHKRPSVDCTTSEDDRCSCHGGAAAAGIQRAAQTWQRAQCAIAAWPVRAC